jgi:hypothetical protein
MFWSRDRVLWTQKMPSLLGEQVSGSKGVNFTLQAGVYLLHDESRVVYVGKAVDQGLGVPKPLIGSMEPILLVRIACDQ